MKTIAAIFTGILYFSSQVFSQNVGIGTTTPTEIFSVKANGKGISQESPDGTVKVGFFTDNTSAFLQTHSNHPLRFSTNNGPTQMILTQNGNFGIGVTTPAFLLDVAGRIRLQNQSNGNSAGIWFNDPSNTNTIGFMGVADATTFGLYGNTAGWGLAMNTNTGNIGIKTLAPANKLQIGAVGPAGFNGNDFAIGNGTNALVINQGNTTLLASTTDIVFMPRNNGHGRVGINTNTPIATLDVADFVNITSSYAHLAYNGTGGCTNCTIPASIYASNRIMAAEFDAYSDERIKNIIAKSNASHDLEIINSLRITDYTMKDKVKYGNKTFKKVIAQEVEKVYPQVVSKHTDFVPNVYQIARKIEKTSNGYLLSFTSKHDISKGAKKLRVLLSDEDGMQAVNIVSIPSDTEVVIDVAGIKADNAFVYGEEVDDFRTVDYEGLTTLNISATQELSKQLKKQQQQIKLQQQQILLLAGEIKSLKRPSNKLTSAKQNVRNSKTKKSRS